MNSNICGIPNEEANVKARFNPGFVLTFYPLLTILELNKAYVSIISHIIKKMNKNNVYTTSGREIAKKLHTDETNVSKKLIALKEAGIILRDRKRIFFNPTYAVKCNRTKQKSLAKLWMGSKFPPDVDDEDMIDETDSDTTTCSPCR